MTTTKPDDTNPHRPDTDRGYVSVAAGECIDVDALRRVLTASAPNVPLRLVTNLATGKDEPIGDAVISGEGSSAAVELRIRTSTLIEMTADQLTRRINGLDRAASVRVRPAADLAMSVAVLAVMASTEPPEKPAVYVYVEPIN